MKFSDKLQKIRKDNNITQEGLADKLNVSRQAVSKWESGIAYPDTEKLIQISKIFNVSLDELINDNKESSLVVNKKINFMDIINGVLEFISKSINMFWSMKFSEKFKCLFEMVILVLMVVFASVVSISVISNLMRRIFIFLPGEVIYLICNLIETLLYIVWIILGGIIVVKIFKTRYLDYYVIIKDDSIMEKVIEEPIKELKEKKEYKVVIRDPEHSSLNIIKRISKVFLDLFKVLCSILVIPLVIMFIFFMVILVFSLFYLFDGLFFVGIVIALIGILFLIYLMIEFIYNLIFNRNHALTRIFIIFICGISLMGIGIGFSLYSLSMFNYNENDLLKSDSHIIEMSDNLVLYEIYGISSDKIVIDNSLDYIKLDISTYDSSDIYIYRYTEFEYDGYKSFEYEVIDIYSDYNEFDMYKNIIDDIKNGEINNINYNYYTIDKIYLSQDNLEKLRDNYLKYTYTE